MSSLRDIYITDPNDVTRRAELDSLFPILTTITVAHHEIHEGAAFACDAVDDTMTTTDTLVLAFKTAAGTKRVHLVIVFVTLTGGYMRIIEAPTWDNQSGTLQPIYNHKREASMNSSTLLEDQAQAGFVASDNMNANPTTLAGGTIVHEECVFGTKQLGAGQSRGTAEWILKPDTQYAIEFTATAISNAAQLQLNWYEHTDG